MDETDAIKEVCLDEGLPLGDVLFGGFVAGLALLPLPDWAREGGRQGLSLLGHLHEGLSGRAQLGLGIAQPLHEICYAQLTCITHESCQSWSAVVACCSQWLVAQRERACCSCQQGKEPSENTAHVSKQS